ncbi:MULTISPECIES: YdcF family protein [unclassified Enterococcus]|uniref:YdcF family protein n=1 Tax=unclassified Enterococcus TaxID=2608891 RepID=UPI0013EB0384|nr:MULTISPECIES: YdcF family protein [unclassified Enterococcus]
MEQPSGKNILDNRNDWNLLLSFLADAGSQTFDQLDAPLLILAGNCLPILADKAAELYLNGQVQQLFFVGGVGHATKFLVENFAKQGYHFEDGLSESEMCYLYLKEKYQLPEDVVLLEKQSTNSGENAAFSLEILRSCKTLPSDILLMNDPTLQRRTKATFEKVWEQEEVTFTNAVPFIPEITQVTEDFLFSDSELNHQWTKEYFQALVLGEMIRLKDDENGYGPKGKGFIPHVEIPEEVWSAYQRLQATTQHFSRA